MNKLRSFFPNAANNLALNRNSGNLEPELGFQLMLDLCPSEASNHQQQPSKQTSKISPQLNVHLISARHLPSLFGFKTVQGYVVKVKLFPGSTKYDSCIQTNTWPKFNENFKFPMEPDRKSTIKMSPITKTSQDVSSNQIDKLFSGQFVVLTVYALLELPPGNFNRFNKTYRSLKDRSTSLVQRITEQGANTPTKNSKSSGKENASKDSKASNGGKDNKDSKEVSKVEMTKTESKRNIGSVTCYLEPKLFKRNSRNDKQYLTDELWYPIKDLTVSTPKNAPSKATTTTNLSSSAGKGQLELCLELYSNENNETPNITHRKSLPVSSKTSASNSNPSLSQSSQVDNTGKKTWMSDLKRRLSMKKSKFSSKDLILKVTTTKFRCSIKVKDELESVGGQIYVKTTIYDGDIPINSWKSNHFIPSLSTRWDPKNSTIEVPLPNMEFLKQMRIKSTICTKGKVGKKIVLGTIVLNSTAVQPDCLEHWNLMSQRNGVVMMWHNFE